MAGKSASEWRSSERHYTLTETTFTKRELKQVELPTNKSPGLVVAPRWSRERLQNEAAALRYIASETSIPVPKFLGLYGEHGLLHLQTKRVHGIPLDEIDEASALTAVDRVNGYLGSYVLPQLRTLRHDTLSSVDSNLPLILPSRMTYRDKRSSWVRKKLPTKSTSAEDHAQNGETTVA